MSDFVPAAGTPAALAQAEAAVHGSTVAFWWAAGILAAGALVTALLFQGRHASARRAVAGAPVPGVAG